MNETEKEIENVAFNIISNAGEARSLLMNNIQQAEKGNFTKIDSNSKEAQECLKAAEKAHFNFISKQMNDHKSDVNLLLVHAEDQMMSAELLQDLSESIVKANKKIRKLEEKIKQ